MKRILPCSSRGVAAVLSIILLAVTTPVALPQEDDEDEQEGAYTPAAGSAERKAILDTLRAEYTTGSGKAVKFKVNHFKVNGDWTWINVVPLDRSGTPEGEEWPSLLQKKRGRWVIIDLMAIAAAIDDPVGPMEPSAKFKREVRRRYPGVPQDIFP